MSAVPEALQKLLKDSGLAGAEGWGALDPASPQNAAAKERAAIERWQQAKEIADAFSDAKGQRALQALRELTVMTPAWKVYELGIANAIGFGIFREGQNSLIHYIDRQLEIAAQGVDGSAPASLKRKRAAPQ